MKFIEVGKREKEIIDSEVDAGAALLGMNDEGTKLKHHTVFTQLGLCKDCSNLRAIETQWGKVYALCDEFGFKLRLRYDDPVHSCTRYSLSGQMSLWDMKEMAILLDPNKKITGFSME